MNQIEIIKRSRNMIRDLTSTLFREQDVQAYINEGIERVGQVIPELAIMPLLNTHLDEVIYMPRHYQHLLAVYTSARLCTQDERHYQAGTFMNEFETKLAQLSDDINNGDVEILDPITNEPIDFYKRFSYVENEYFNVGSEGVRRYKKYEYPRRPVQEVVAEEPPEEVLPNDEDVLPE